MQDSIFRQPRPCNREQLIARVKEEWESIDQETTMTLVESFQKQILGCDSNNGHHTKYGKSQVYQENLYPYGNSKIKLISIISD